MADVRRIVGGVITTGVAAAILVLAIPNAVVSFRLLGADWAWDGLISGARVPVFGLTELRGALRDTQKWLPSGENLYRQGFTERGLARTELPGTPDRVAWNQAAEGAFEAGLSRAPSNPHGWVMLAHMRNVNGVPEGGVADALRMSLLTGPYQRVLAPLRISTALDVWGTLGPADRVQFAEQIRWTNTFNQIRLMEITLRDDRFRPIVVGALSADPKAMGIFVEGLRRLYLSK